MNVTSQCEKEQHIKYLEEYNRKIIEALPEFIFIFDDNFFITDVLMAPGTILLHPVEVLRGADGLIADIETGRCPMGGEEP